MIDESWSWSEISRGTSFTKWTFQVLHWKVEKYWALFRQKNYFTCNSVKRDRAALVGPPPAAPGPQDIPHQRTAWPELFLDTKRSRASSLTKFSGKKVSFVLKPKLPYESHLSRHTSELLEKIVKNNRNWAAKQQKCPKMD